MSIEAKIKEEVMKTTYGNIDTLFDYMDQRFDLSEENKTLIIKELNKLKDRLYLIAENSRLS
jgi:hypothetical protein